jgi:hypothetical protein
MPDWFDKLQADKMAMDIKWDMSSLRLEPNAQLTDEQAAKYTNHTCELPDGLTPGSMYTCPICTMQWTLIGTQKHARWRRRYG